MNNKVINTKPMKMITDSSSKGNQPKWLADGLWYKADHMGYEGLSEIVISKLLAETNTDGAQMLEYSEFCNIQANVH